MKRYLDYNFEMKKDSKIEETEMMDLLNDDLRSTLTLYTNGRILKTVVVFDEFPLEFLCNLTFVLQHRSFAIDEYIFGEGDDGHELYFITDGKVSLLHRATGSFIINLHKESAFGEIGFFTEA